ncbi:DNA polymerase III subunit delta [termite gut metagenome]|uniref:DNA polymerase III subunit delta n=2 Tax=termite gut metagenome TaxID=433724 RepID=A0A5J4SP45_9ZZZZ
MPADLIITFAIFVNSINRYKFNGKLTYEDILNELKNKRYRPIYYLMGEEAYYIDLIADFIEENILSETEKEFNLTVMYGMDVDVATIINAAKRYPMMSEYQVVIVKEAQTVHNMEALSYYLQKPMKSTILVICHKHGTLDGRKKLASEIERIGILFESKKSKDAQLPVFITSYLKNKNIEIDSKATAMLADFVGSELSRLTGELEKLIITLPNGQNRITPEQIEVNIGISKDYNNFELRSALLDKDVLKANKIIKYFEENPKSNPLQMTLSLLFSFFSNLMLAYYAPEKSEQGIANMLGLRSTWQAREYVIAMRKYNGIKTMQIISEIRAADAKSKGIGNYSMSDGDILRELIFKILH